jgi:AcrR family transcriptional regulator
MKTSVKAGRPTGFDTDRALDVALRLFWERGYEGTSMADLSQEMGIHPSSIYAAFGDKQDLLALAAKRYADVPAEHARVLMREMRLQNEAAIKARLLKARKAREFPREENIDDYTRYLSSLLSGLAVQAANGSTRAELKRTAEVALRHLSVDR